MSEEPINFRTTFEIAVKLKKVMLKKNLRRARAPCPNCPGKFIHGALAGPKNHIHMSCECKKMALIE